MKKNIFIIITFLYSLILSLSASIENTPLHTACMKGNIELVQTLIQNGADVNARNSINGTPIHAIGFNGHAEIATLLIKAGANINAQDKNGICAINWAFLIGHTHIIELLLKEGANPFIKDNENITIFDLLKAPSPLLNDLQIYEKTLIIFVQHLRYHAKFNVSYEEYIKAHNILFSEKNRELLIQHARKVTANHPTHPFQRLFRSKQSMLK